MIISKIKRENSSLTKKMPFSGFSPKFFYFNFIFSDLQRPGFCDRQLSVYFLNGSRLKLNVTSDDPNLVHLICKQLKLPSLLYDRFAIYEMSKHKEDTEWILIRKIPDFEFFDLNKFDDAKRTSKDTRIRLCFIRNYWNGIYIIMKSIWKISLKESLH